MIDPVLQEFKIFPILGRKVDVPADDPEMLVPVTEGAALSHDAGGINFDLARKRKACVRSNGYSQWSNTANAQATKCQGLFELYDGTNRNHMYMDNGVVYNYDAARDPNAITDAKLAFTGGGTTVPTIGETITGATSGATGILARYEEDDSGTWAGGDAVGTFYLQTVVGTFEAEDLNGATSGLNMATSAGALATTTFDTADASLTSSIKVGSYWAFSDKGNNIPYKWKHGDQRLTPLDATGTYTTGDDDGFKFKHLVSFSRRVIGLDCPNDTEAGDISVHWSTAWPGTSIANLTFSSSNQLYIPNDDSIVGGATMGTDKCFIYCDNSIQQLVYYADYESPFRCFTVVPQEGAISDDSIVNLGYAHLFYNKNYGFCMYQGGSQVTPIGDDLTPDMQEMIQDNAHLMVGKFVPTLRCAVWSLPMVASSSNNRLLFWNIDTKQWFWEDKIMRVIDFWQSYSTYSWIDLIRDLGGTGKSRGTADTDTASHLVDSGADFVTAGVIIGDEALNTTDETYANVTAVAETDLTLDADVFPDGDETYEVGTGAIWADAGSNSWAYYVALARYLVYAATDGHLYTHASESLPGSSELEGYRVEPVLDFGDAKRKDLLQEIWFSLNYTGSHSITVYHRSGDTLAEISNGAWTSVGTISCDSPPKPVVYVNQNGRLHQIKWGTFSDAQYFEVSSITFKFVDQGAN